MEQYRCLCGQPLAMFVLPQFGLPVSAAYVRSAVADALAAHLERLDAHGAPADRDLHGVVADGHGDGEPWVLDPGREPRDSQVAGAVRGTVDE